MASTEAGRETSTSAVSAAPEGKLAITRACPRTASQPTVPLPGALTDASVGSGVEYTIGAPCTTASSASYATAVNVVLVPLTTVPVAGAISTRTASDPGPTHSSSTSTSCGSRPSTRGCAITCTGPPANTVSPAAFRYRSSSSSGSPSRGASGGSGNSSESGTSLADAGKSMMRDSSSSPFVRCRITRTRLNGTTLPDPSTTDIGPGSDGATARSATRPNREPSSGPVTSRPHERRLSTNRPARAISRRLGERCTRCSLRTKSAQSRAKSGSSTGHASPHGTRGV